MTLNYSIFYNIIVFLAASAVKTSQAIHTSSGSACSPRGSYQCDGNTNGFFICTLNGWLGPLMCGEGQRCMSNGVNSVVCALADSPISNVNPVQSTNILPSGEGVASNRTCININRHPANNAHERDGEREGKTKKKIVGYFPNWTYWQTHVPLTVPDIYGERMTHVNHAFASLAYSPSHDVWFVTPSDPQVDFFISVGNDNAASMTPNCLDVSKYTCGSKWNPHLPLVPYIGATQNGFKCDISADDCWNPAGTTTPPGRGIPCSADIGAYLKHSKYACGYVGYYSQQLKKSHPNIKVLLSLGGWYDSNGFSSAVSPRYVDSTITAIKAYLEAFRFDGIDIDWEYPGYEHGQQPMFPGAPAGDGTPDDVTDCKVSRCAYPGRTEDGINFVNFLQKLKHALRGKLVTIAAPAGQDKLTKFNLKAVCDTLDFINLMAYDMNGAWSPMTNHQAPLYDKSPYQTTPGYSIAHSIHVYRRAGCNMSKIILGVPFYARVFSGVTKGPGPLYGLYQNHSHQGLPSGNLPSYAQIVSSAGWQYMTDSSAVGALAWNDELSQLASFDNPNTISLKAQYLKGMGLGGWMLWALGYDTPNSDLYKAMVAGF